MTSYTPNLASDVALDDWMWWSAGRTTSSGNNFRIKEVLFDVKVKRILNGNDFIRFAIIGSAAHDTLFNARILSKYTGTR